MRYVYGLILLLLVAVIGLFAWLQREPVPINYYDQHMVQKSISRPMYEIIAGAYVLGMLSGWTVVGFVKRSVQRVTQRQEPKA
jgi:hypothetical protein